MAISKGFVEPNLDNMHLLDLSLRFRVIEGGSSSNPQLRDPDRSRVLQGISVGAPDDYRIDLGAGETVTIFDGSRAIGFDNTTQLHISGSPLSPDRYRLSWTNVGPSPGFRTDRGLAPSGSTLVLVLNANGSITVSGSGPSYVTIQVGDDVLIPGVATGDSTTNFDSRNVGYWTVIQTDNSTSFTMARQAGWSGAVAQASVLANNNLDIQVFSPAGVRAGDQLELFSGFALSALKAYQILSVAASYVDIQSTLPVATETAIPGANGLVVYSSARKVIQVEVDGIVALFPNGQTSETLKVDPLVLPDGTSWGVQLLTGPVWKLDVKNKSSLAVSGRCVAVR